MQLLGLLPLSLLLLAAGHVGAEDVTVDVTVKEKGKGRAVVDAVVDLIVQSCVFNNDQFVLRRIAYAETHDGQHGRTFKRQGVDYYGGIWQVDEPSFNSTKTSFDDNIYSRIEDVFGINWKNAQYKDLWKPLYCGLAARMKIAQHYNDSEIPQGVQKQADYWKRDYTINSWGNAEQKYKVASKLVAKRNCSSRKLDLVFVVDGSDRIGQSDFDKAKNFIKDVIGSGSFKNRNQKARIAMITYSTSTRVVFDFEEYNKKKNPQPDIIGAVDKVEYEGGGSNSSGALEVLSSFIKEKGRQGSGIPVAVVFLTDGYSDNQTATDIAADAVHRELPQVPVFAVGVGSNINKSRLEDIASKPKCLYVYSMSKLTDHTGFSDQIMGQACKVSVKLPKGGEVNGAAEKGEHYYFKVKVQKKGVKVKVRVKSGRVVVYFSRKHQTPNAALYDIIKVINGTEGDSVTITIKWSDNAGPDSNQDENRRKARSAEELSQTLYGAVEGVETGQNEFTLGYTEDDSTNTGNALAASLFSFAIAYFVTFFL